MANGYGWKRESATGARVILAGIVLAVIPAVTSGQDAFSWAAVRGEALLSAQLPRNYRSRQLRFSPDGKYVLARYSSGVAVLALEPFRVLFHQPAENVGDAGFTPDSQQVWFTTRPANIVGPGLAFAGSSAYIERWSIADAALIDKKETRLRGCENARLSADSRILACVDAWGVLRLIDIDSAKTIFEKRNFGPAAELTFSPDGRYFAASPNFADGPPRAWDLRAKTEIKMAGRLRKRASGDHIAFEAADQMMISSLSSGSAKVNATRVTFPSGKVLSKSELLPAQLFHKEEATYVLFRPFGWTVHVPGSGPEISAMEFRSKQQIESGTEALDVFGDRFVIELPDGKLGLGKTGRGIQSSVTINP
jgi:hypothetical protein